MKSLIAPFVVLCCFVTACHRPYALYQRTASPPFRSPKSVTPTPVSVADSTDWAALVPAAAPDLAAEPVAYASARPGIPVAASTNRHTRSLADHRTEPQSAAGQPKPKPKRGQAEPQRKTLREVLGLKPRPKLNWWQRISWRLKAAVVVVLVAVVFAILHITVLAIIFGVIGAFLLVKGLKKSFKVRRPLF